jgi:hypothetical protein
LKPDLRDERVGNRGSGDPVAELVGGVRVEVAVSAADAAERDVDVNAERSGLDTALRAYSTTDYW